MAKRKAGDQAGQVVEMLQRGGRRLHESLAELFNDLLDPVSEPPEYWKETRLKVLFKRGDHTEPGNYRPIAILPILYKLFTKIVCNRIRVHIEANSRVDLAGFRTGFSTEDHIFTILNLMEKMSEFQLPLWIAAIDFHKAFDTVEHDSLWGALFKMEVHPTYIRVLAAMYAGQRGVVVDERDSKMFDIKRGTKQGDPLSPSLFNAVLEQAFSEVLPLWQKRKYGIEVDNISKTRLCNLRFADDLLLIASTKRQLTRMLKELMEAVNRVGLVMHPGKTKILTNVGYEHWHGSEFVMVNDDKVEILKPEASTMYLGWALCFEATQDVELENRINKGWAKFMIWKNELCCKRYPLNSRLKLFNAVVTPSVLYACGSWTMTARREMLLRTAQRRMLRKFWGAFWKKNEVSAPLASTGSTSDSEDEQNTGSGSDIMDVQEDSMQKEESWVEWIQRTTGVALKEAEKAKVPDWVLEQRRRKWQWAGHLMRRTDSRWSTTTLLWTPVGGQRRVGHPPTRWTDSIEAMLNHCGKKWAALAFDRSAWAEKAAHFAAKRW